MPVFGFFKEIKWKENKNFIVVVLSVPVILTFLEFMFLFWGNISRLLHLDFSFHFAPIYQYIYWSCFCLAGYVAVPVVLLLLLRENPLDYGIVSKAKGKFKERLKIVAGLYLAVLPFIVFVSYTAAFKRTYPFCHQIKNDMALFFVFELFYFLQFVGLEFFFRGYLLFTLEKLCGNLSIFLMSVPYCMIHYHKPMPEALAAIIAGLVLGQVALKTRSIWSTVLVHYLVAITMDIASILQQGGFSF